MSATSEPQQPINNLNAHGNSQPLWYHSVGSTLQGPVFYHSGGAGPFYYSAGPMLQGPVMFMPVTGHCSAPAAMVGFVPVPVNSPTENGLNNLADPTRMGFIPTAVHPPAAESRNIPVTHLSQTSSYKNIPVNNGSSLPTSLDSSKYKLKIFAVLVQNEFHSF